MLLLSFFITREIDQILNLLETLILKIISLFLLRHKKN